MTSQTIAVLLVASLGAILTAAVAWLLGRRQNSGQVDTSDAATLWTASEQMRKELRAEVVMLREQAVLYLSEIEQLRNAAITHLKKIDELQKRLDAAEGGRSG
jgi:uncharacterized protein HemX